MWLGFQDDWVIDYVQYYEVPCYYEVLCMHDILLGMKGALFMWNTCPPCSCLL